MTSGVGDRGAYAPVNRSPEDAESQTLPPRRPPRRPSWVPRALVLVSLGLFLTYVGVRALNANRVEADAPPMQVDPHAVVAIMPADEGLGMPTFLHVDEKARHRSPFLTKEKGVDPALVEKDNAELYKKDARDSRFGTYLILDKPVYRPGETVRGSCFLLSAFGNTLSSSAKDRVYGRVIIKDPKNVEIASLDPGMLESGVWAFQWAIPKQSAGGDYKIEFLPNKYGKVLATSVERSFEVRATRVSNAKINKRIVFKRDGYGASDEVKASIHIDGHDETQVKFTATVDSQIVFESGLIDIQKGEADVSFMLPSKMSRGEGVLVAKVMRGPITESTSKTIPIITQKLDLGVFPEGGVLIKGTRQRVYVEALDSVSGKPVDFSAGIFSDNDPTKPLAMVRSVHEGRGVSEYLTVPSSTERVFLKIISPAAVSGQAVDIPFRTHADARDSASLSIPQSIFQNDLSVEVISAGKAKYRVGVYKREKELGSKDISTSSSKGAESFQSQVLFKLGDIEDHFGVLRVTLFNDQNHPLAERLVFRTPLTALEIEVSSTVTEDVEDIADTPLAAFQRGTVLAAPSDGIGVNIRTWIRRVDPQTGNLVGERKAAASVVSLRVTDSALAATIEERLLPPRLPAAVLLEAEVDRLHDAGSFLPGTSWGWHVNQQASERDQKASYFDRLDLLLGTQGWRRFAYYDASSFLKHGVVAFDAGKYVPVTLQNDKDIYPSSPVSKVALERMMQIFPREQPIMYATGNGTPVFAKQARGPFREEVMIAEAMPMHAAMAQVDMVMDMAMDDANDANLAMGEAPPMADEGATNEMEQDIVDEAEAEVGDVDGIAADADEPVMGKRIAPAMEQDVMLLRRPYIQYERIYAHPQRKYLKKELKDGAKRSDFTETVYFNPSLVTKCNSKRTICEARVSFGLSDSSSATFVVHADGISHSSLGSSHMHIEVSAPLEVDLSLPSIIVSGDSPLIPVTVRTQKEEGISLQVAFSPSNSHPFKLKHSSNEYTMKKSDTSGARIYMNILSGQPTKAEKQINVTVSARSDAGVTDTVVRSTTYVSRGFPASSFKGGVLVREPFTYELVLPKDYLPNTLEVVARAYTSPVGRLTKALEELIREPHGCFEQTSSTTYPLVFVIQYLKTHSGSNPAIIKKATEMLQRGYEKLAAYESPGGGFEWFGGEPGHEALTAYGLLQFAAMSHPTVGLKIDRKMLERTKTWMNSRRDGNGGFLRNEKALDSFGAAPISTTNAYITWSLIRAGLLRSRKNDKEVNALVHSATDAKDPASKDPYIVALAALSLYDATNPSPEELRLAGQLADKLISMQDEEDGALRHGALDTITRSRGEALEIETTALGVLVWLHESKKYAANARAAIDFLASKCKNGRFSSTQATALSLMAIVEFDKVYSKPLPQGRVEFLVNGEVVDSHPITSKQSETSSEDVEELGEEEDGECTGGSVWNECGIACVRRCDTPEFQPCTMQCVPRCQCPPEKPILNSDGVCVSVCDASTEDADSEGVITFSSSKILAALDTLDLKSTPSTFGARLVLQDPVEEDPSIPYSLAFKYSVLTPTRKSTEPLLALSVALENSGSEKTNPVEGDVVTIRARLQNIAQEDGVHKPLPLVVAVIGIPGGFEPRTDQLRELKESKVIDFVETQPGQVILYWRTLKPQATLEVPIQVVATIPGTYESPASRAYLFYTDEDKVWAKGSTVTIDPAPSRDGKKNRVW